VQRHENGRPLDWHLWTLMSFELWCRTFLDRQAGNAPWNRMEPRDSHVVGPRA
jgi:hypothetical protein